MKTMHKYLAVLSCELKRSTAYRAQVLLLGPFSLVKVLLAHLLWRAVLGTGQDFGGFTLPAMTSYYLLSGAIAPLCGNQDALFAFSAEIKGGAFSKYLVRPLSPMGYYLASGVGQALLRTAVAMLMLLAAMLAAPGYFQPLRAADLLAALPVVALAAVLGGLTAYLIALATFRLTDIGFLYAAQNLLLLFLSGSLLPLNLLLGERLAMVLPFSYLLYYPTMCMLGMAPVPVPAALTVMAGWCAVLALLGRLLGRRARGLYEGVGM